MSLNDLSCRRKVLRISSQLFLDWFRDRGVTTYCKVVEQPIPEDCRIVSVLQNYGYVRTHDEITCLLESPEFEPVPEGTPWPEIEVKFRTVETEIG